MDAATEGLIYGMRETSVLHMVSFFRNSVNLLYGTNWDLN
jgi:hypothetical protein